MKKLVQTRLHKGDKPELRGNCFPTIIACLMDLESPEDVIQIQEYYDDPQWHMILFRWLNDKGWEWAAIEGHLFDDSIYMVIGPSPRAAGVDHVVLYQNGKMVHDPHPDGTGILSERTFEIIYRLPVSSPSLFF